MVLSATMRWRLVIEGLIDDAHPSTAEFAHDVETGENGRGRDIGHRRRSARRQRWIRPRRSRIGAGGLIAQIRAWLLRCMGGRCHGCESVPRFRFAALRGSVPASRRFVEASLTRVVRYTGPESMIPRNGRNRAVASQIVRLTAFRSCPRLHQEQTRSPPRMDRPFTTVCFS